MRVKISAFILTVALIFASPITYAGDCSRSGSGRSSNNGNGNQADRFSGGDSGNTMFVPAFGYATVQFVPMQAVGAQAGAQTEKTADSQALFDEIDRIFQIIEKVNNLRQGLGGMGRERVPAPPIEATSDALRLINQRLDRLERAAGFHTNNGGTPDTTSSGDWNSIYPAPFATQEDAHPARPASAVTEEEVRQIVSQELKTFKTQLLKEIIQIKESKEDESESESNEGEGSSTESGSTATE